MRSGTSEYDQTHVSNNLSDQSIAGNSITPRTPVALHGNTTYRRTAQYVGRLLAELFPQFASYQDVIYDDFIANFTASKFNASAWVDLFDKAGAKYFVLVTVSISHRVPLFAANVLLRNIMTASLCSTLAILRTAVAYISGRSVTSCRNFFPQQSRRSRTFIVALITRSLNGMTHF
jgi:hypothetical protein